jgi:hypothetical protein
MFLFLLQGDYHMNHEDWKKSQLYAVVFILIGTSFIPMLGVASPTHTTSTMTALDPKRSVGNDTQYWALLVGVGIYAENPEQDRPDMLLEVNDFKNVLLQTSWWSADHIKVITAENATIPNVLAGFHWLKKVAGSNDIVVVYLSTHGFPLAFDVPPLDEGGNKDTGLISYWGFAYPMFIWWDDEVNVLLNRIDCKGVCLLVDSCYAGGFQDHWKIPKSAEPQKRVTIMGSCEDEVSYSGGFAPYVIDGLRGYADSNADGVVTAQEVFQYASPRAIPQQHPTMYDNYPGGLALTTSTPHKASSQVASTSQQNGRSAVSPIILPTLVENSVICGYVNTSGQPVGGALITASGRINHSQSYQNHTTTDQAGFYSMHVPAMRLRVTASAQGYCDASKGPYNIPQNRTFWVNLSLMPRPTETAAVCGYVSSAQNGTPLVANATLHWIGNQGNTYRNTTNSDGNGFYRMSVAPGYIDLTVSKEGYFTESRDELNITASQVIWENISLYHLPAETSAVCGYITDSSTGTPLQGAQIGFYWVNITVNHSYMREARTNATGFYTTPIAPGELYIDLQANGYDFYNPYRHDAPETAPLWMNLSLQKPQLGIEFMKPLNALYVHDTRIFPISDARIIGPITISVLVSGSFYEPGHAAKVEFYIDGSLKTTFTTEPYNWTWTQKTVGKHVIKVIAYDAEGNSFSKEIEVRKFL